MGNYYAVIQRLTKAVGMVLVSSGLLGMSVVQIFTPTTAYAADESTGQLVVHLNTDPATAATVTITRAAQVSSPSLGKVAGTPETFTLRPVTGPKVTGHQNYTSDILPYSGLPAADYPTGCGANSPENPQNDPWYTWNIKVSGSATGTGSAVVNCGLSVLANVNVTLASGGNGGGQATNGTITGNVLVDGQWACNPSASKYWLTAPGVEPDQTTGGTAFPSDASGNYSIQAPPGTYDLTIRCSYSPNGQNTPEITTLVEKNVVVTAGVTTTLDDNAVGNSSGSDDTKTTDADNCGGGVLGWVMCPVISGALQAASWIEDFNISMLNVDVRPIFDEVDKNGSASQGYYKAWNSFRVIAIAILVIAGLIMVVSQALGFELLDAYTIRKVLPRLLMAIIGISLSWPLMRLGTGFFDTLGFDVRNLIYGPFMHLPGGFTPVDNMLASGVVIGTVAVLGFASLTFILSLLLAVFVGFMVLIFRQVAIVMLIITAPVAIACSVLPNTNRVWKAWFDSFLGLMLMFPIYSAIVAAGHVYAAVALSSGG